MSLPLISIHAPREGCDTRAARHVDILRLFQSTHPARGATAIDFRVHVDTLDFNPRTPRGVRLFPDLAHNVVYIFQSTHPARGATESQEIENCANNLFQSTHPARGATSLDNMWADFMEAFQSTHPARGATFAAASSIRSDTNFNPRTPRGVRPGVGFNRAAATKEISIHAPREGCDKCGYPISYFWSNFNPRTPRGVRRAESIDDVWAVIISIHAPREGCDSP